VPDWCEYRIQATLDAEKKVVHGHMKLRWTNRSTQPVPYLAFHLYMNAFRDDDSAFMRESGGSFPNGRHMDRHHWGGIDLSKVRVDGRERRPVVAGCPNPPCKGMLSRDETVMRIDLDQPVPPGGQSLVEMDFTTRLPRVFARTGYEGRFYMVAQWYPSIGVWQQGKWNCHAFHAASEFFAEFGRYDVTIDLPAGWVVGATGIRKAVEQESKPAKGRQVVRFEADRVHDFAFATGPNLRETSITIHHRIGAGTVRLRLVSARRLFAPARGQLRLTARALGLLEAMFGSYPYDELTVVVPPVKAEAASGMEYPTLFVTSVSPPGLLSWLGVLLDEQTTVHELTHQYFQGILASNEAEEAWLDEGFTTYVTGLLMDRMFGADRSVLRFGPLALGYFPQSRLVYLYKPGWDPIRQSSWRYADIESYGTITYYKSTCLLRSLQGLIGQDAMRRILRLYVARFAFRHPTTDDFLAVVRDVAGSQVASLLREALDTSGTLDYRVASIRNPSTIEGKREKRTRRPSEVLIQRVGSLRWPVDVLVRFDDGAVIRKTWDGKKRWVRYRFSRKSRIAEVQLDPDRKLWLDLDFLNDGLTAQVHRAGAHRVGTWYGLTLQWLMGAVGF